MGAPKKYTPEEYAQKESDRHRRYYEEHRERLNAYHRAYYREHRDEITGKAKLRRLENPELNRKIARAYYLEHCERICAQADDYRKRNRANPENVRWGQRLRACRKAEGLKQAELAEKLGVGPSAVSHYETAELPLPQWLREWLEEMEAGQK